MNDIAILSLGLMGGSLGLALKARGRAGRVTGYARRRETRELALERGAVDAAFASPADAVRGAGLVVVCAPVLTIPELMRACAPGLAAGCVVTDVGSTKAWIQRQAEAALAGTGAHFVGSHPVAGSEKSGLEAAGPGLYEGAVTVVTAPAGAPAAAVAAVERLWSGVGSRVVRMTPEEHDRALARTSHLPHLAAATIALSCGRPSGAAPEHLRLLCGPGFRDTTRVAEGSPEIWHDIVRTNRAAILEELQALIAQLEGLRSDVEEERYESVRRRLADGGEARRRLTAGGAHGVRDNNGENSQP